MNHLLSTVASEWFEQPESLNVSCLQGKPTVAEMDAIGDIWRPYRSLGSYYMWRVPTSTQKSIKKKSVSTAAATAATADVTPAI